MRVSEPQIKQAILHPEEEVRLTALGYFADSYTQDETVMPLVIEAVEQHGRDHAFRVMRDAERLPQTPSTIDWLIKELGDYREPKSLEGDNHRSATALVVLNADPELVVKRHKEIVALFPDGQLTPAFDDRLKMHFWDWSETWAVLEQLGHETMEKDTIEKEHVRRNTRLLKALARHGDEHNEQVLNILRRQYKRDDKPLMDWMEPWTVDLAGRMRLQKAIPHLIKRLDEGHESVMDEVGPALSRIGTENVIQAVNQAWWDADSDRRFALCEPLEHIHCDLSIDRAITFLAEEDDPDIALALGHAALSHFDTQAIEPARDLVCGEDEELEPDQWDLRWKLVATCVVMGEAFPEFEEWHQEALENNYGWGHHEHDRLSDTF